MKCPYCGLVIARIFYPIVWENHINIHEILKLLLEMREEEVNK